MRSLRLARVAAEAEGLRLRRQARRTAIRVVVGLIGLIFVGWAVALAHVAAWFCLRDGALWGPTGTAAALCGGDLVIAALLAVIAARSSPGRIEMEALEVRRRALESATGRFALASTLVPALRLALDLLRRPK
jgi:hypothetical protein